jgi:hypothetical protein
MLYRAQALGSHEVLGIHHMPGTYIYDCTHLQSTAIHCLLSDTVFQIPTKPNKRGILWTSLWMLLRHDLGGSKRPGIYPRGRRQAMPLIICSRGHSRRRFCDTAIPSAQRDLLKPYYPRTLTESHRHPNSHCRVLPKHTGQACDTYSGLKEDLRASRELLESRYSTSEVHKINLRFPHGHRKLAAGPNAKNSRYPVAMLFFLQLVEQWTTNLTDGESYTSGRCKMTNLVHQRA